jgi:alpha-L-arabinofuranosidase
MIQSTPSCAHIKIAVTEWNESAGDWGLGRGQQMTLQNALHNARYLNLLMRHSDKVEIACRSSIANSFCGGLIQTSPSGLLKRPGYYALQLFARHAKPIPLRVEQPEGGPDLFACGSENKRFVTIFAVNSKTRPVDLSFDLDGFNGAIRTITAETLCDTLNAHQSNAMNHWEAPDRIRIVSLAASPGTVTLPPLSVAAIECAIK